MKKLFGLLLILPLMFVACGDDDACELGTFDENIVGTWDTPAIGDSEAGTVTFNADGTGVGSDNGLFYAELNGAGSGDFDWTYDATENAMTIGWNFGGTGSLEVDMGVVEYDCDETTLNFILDVTMTRR